MPIIYQDTILTDMLAVHPALVLDVESSMIQMVRYGSIDRSVFRWSRHEALAMYKWYAEGYNDMDIKDEFGVTIQAYDFRNLIRNSYYETDEGISDDTIEEAWFVDNPEPEPIPVPRTGA